MLKLLKKFIINCFSVCLSLCLSVCLFLCPWKKNRKKGGFSCFYSKIKKAGLAFFTNHILSNRLFIFLLLLYYNNKLLPIIKVLIYIFRVLSIYYNNDTEEIWSNWDNINSSNNNNNNPVGSTSDSNQVGSTSDSNLGNSTDANPPVTLNVDCQSNIGIGVAITYGVTQPDNSQGNLLNSERGQQLADYLQCAVEYKKEVINAGSATPKLTLTHACLSQENRLFIENVIRSNPDTTAYSRLVGKSGFGTKLSHVEVTSKVITMLKNVP